MSQASAGVVDRLRKAYVAFHNARRKYPAAMLVASGVDHEIQEFLREYAGQYGTPVNRDENGSINGVSYFRNVPLITVADEDVLQGAEIMPLSQAEVDALVESVGVRDFRYFVLYNDGAHRIVDFSTKKEAEEFIDGRIAQEFDLTRYIVVFGRRRNFSLSQQPTIEIE